MCLLDQINLIGRLFDNGCISLMEALDMLDTLQLLESAGSYGKEKASVLGAMTTLETKLNDRLNQAR